jgi:tetratricopeptide (TPR) repeat protein
MNRTVRIPVMTAALALLLLPAVGCNDLKARDQLNKGVAAYKNARYEEAIGHFQQAVSLSPKLPMARLYLATAYAQNVVTGDDPANVKAADTAIEAYKAVLAEKADDVNALKGIASLYYNTKRLALAKEYNQKVISVDPHDADAYYFIGVIDWTQALQNSIPVRTSLGLKDDGTPIKDKKACADLQAKNTPLITEAIDSLKKALEIRPSDDPSMQYMNLTYRRKAADIDCGDEGQARADMATAQEWVQKAMDTRKANELKKENAAPAK